ncbi:hypothetical protein CROQUDRAFT_93810 [Cronartium quercuum f. sp. fusiforme G11]|uniref:Uncharacterized protein n=1 Tax=Cronartium quercuum f. sp. fusiforme G11 TaxID=708437 RepID=A0A9P6TAP7_9BASI|nr:hypothetical protein CROQUDRAFT_93810 [Cronartium quercuum f. sp. fusiforme G11]
MGSHTALFGKKNEGQFPKKTRKPFPPISGTVPDSTNNLCHPSRAFEPSFNHLQPTRLRSTNLEPEPDSATQARA